MNMNLRDYLTLIYNGEVGVYLKVGQVWLDHDHHISREILEIDEFRVAYLLDEIKGGDVSNSKGCQMTYYLPIEEFLHRIAKLNLKLQE